MRQKAEPMKKNCLLCGGEMIQPRWRNGSLDSLFKNRKFCSIKCYASWVEAKNLCTKAGGRKRAQRKYTLTACVDCGEKKFLQRHHKDGNPLNNSSENIKILCRSCHAKDHINAGTWGRGRVPKAICKICGTEFQPERRRRKGRVICGKISCLMAMGKLSAELRWGSKTE